MNVYVVPSVRTQRLHWLIRRMCYDDTLIFRNWHVVEYLYLERGLPQYRVFRGDELIGVARIRHPARLKFVQSALVDFLVQLFVFIIELRIPQKKQKAQKTGNKKPRGGNKFSALFRGFDSSRITHSCLNDYKFSIFN